MRRSENIYNPEKAEKVIVYRCNKVLIQITFTSVSNAVLHKKHKLKIKEKLDVSLFRFH